MTESKGPEQLFEERRTVSKEEPEPRDGVLTDQIRKVPQYSCSKLFHAAYHPCASRALACLCTCMLTTRAYVSSSQNVCPCPQLQEQVLQMQTEQREFQREQRDLMQQQNKRFNELEGLILGHGHAEAKSRAVSMISEGRNLSSSTFARTRPNWEGQLSSGRAGGESEGSSVGQYVFEQPQRKLGCVAFLNTILCKRVCEHQTCACRRCKLNCLLALLP